MIKALYERLTGTPWTTGRSTSMEYGPSIYTRHVTFFEMYSDDVLAQLTPGEWLQLAEKIKAAKAAQNEHALTAA